MTTSNVDLTLHRRALEGALDALAQLERMTQEARFP